MVRPREFDEDQVRESIMVTFWEKGYEATSMQDLVAATGLLKGSLYGAFGDKQNLYLIALEHYDQTRLQGGINALNSDGSVEERLARLFNSIIDSMNTGVFAGGCLLCDASIEMATVDEKVQTRVKSQLRRLTETIQAVVSRNFENEADQESITAMIVSSYFGARVLAKSGMPVEMIERTRDVCLERVA